MVRRAAAGGDDAKAVLWMECPTCKGEKVGSDGAECGGCGGNGVVERDGLSAEDWACVAEFVSAWSFVEKHGWRDWIAVHGEPDAWFVEACSVFDTELAAAKAVLGPGNPAD